jgi:hypothetical protein
LFQTGFNRIIPFCTGITLPYFFCGFIKTASVIMDSEIKYKVAGLFLQLAKTGEGDRES